MFIIEVTTLYVFKLQAIQVVFDGALLGGSEYLAKFVQLYLNQP